MGRDAGDKLLVERVQRGDSRAFDLLVLRYQQKIVKLVMRFVHDPVEAQDVAQEAFVKAWRAIPGFRGDSTFFTWLYRIAINTAKNYVTALHRRPVDYELDALTPAQLDANARLRDDDTPERLALRDELQATLERTIASLPEELRMAIILREIDGLGYEEIARVMDCPIGTVRSRIFRARETIAAAIAPLRSTESNA